MFVLESSAPIEDFAVEFFIFSSISVAHDLFVLQRGVQMQRQRVLDIV